ncbi:MAG: PqqD family peptide modification chaperone [Waterburya sp.]
MADLRDIILTEYAVTPEVCLNDLLAVLEQLATKELIEIRNEITA